MVAKAVQELRTFWGHPPHAAVRRLAEGGGLPLRNGAHYARQGPPPLIRHPLARPKGLPVALSPLAPPPPPPPTPALDQAGAWPRPVLWGGPCGASSCCRPGGPGVRLERPMSTPTPTPLPTHPPHTHRHDQSPPSPSTSSASSASNAMAFLRLLLVLGTWVALTAAGPFTTAGDDRSCTSTALRSQASRASQQVYPGQGVRLKVTWTNSDRTRTVANGVLQLQLPLHTTYKAAFATVNKHSLARRGDKRPAYDPETRLLTWRGITLRPGGAVLVAVRVKLEPCYSGPSLDFVATAFVDTNGVPTCEQQAVTSVSVVRRRNGRNSGSCAPTPAPTPAPSKMPSVMPTVIPSAAPTVSCVPGEFRPAPTAPCAFCAPGTYWNETSPAIQATSCQTCGDGKISLQGATACYTPCPLNSALNTTDLTCVPIPASLESIAAANNVTLDFNTTEVFIVTEPGKLEDTIGAAAASSNETTVVIVLGPGLYPQTAAYTLTSNVFILVDSTAGEARRRLGAHGPRHLETISVDNAVIFAVSDSRHYIMSNATLFTEGVVFQGSLTSYYSGGVELRNLAQGFFYNSTFRDCHNQTNGGALLLTGGSSAFVGTGSEFFSNEAVQGGAIYVGANCAVTVNSTVRFANNSAPRTSASTGGGGAVYLADASSSLVLDANVLFESNVDNDLTVAAGGSVACANPAYAASVSCSTGCTGSYDIPAACPICSSSSAPAGTCGTCPQGSYSGGALPCELCGFGFTTIFPPSSTSVAACVPITSAPSAQPTQVPSRQPTQTPTLTFSPTQSPTTANPTTTPSSQPTLAGYKAPVAVRYYHDSCVAPPTAEPAPPSFAGGTLYTAGTGGAYSTLSAAIAAASAGDRIQVLPGEITEAAVVTVDKSLEIFGTGPTCIVQRDSTSAVLSISAGVNDVYIHSLGIVNNQAPQPDTGGQSSCITAATMQAATPDGSTGIYIANCTFTFPKLGVSLDAAGWVVKDCVFTPNSNTPGATIRALAPYGSTGQSFATGNTFNNPTQEGVLIAIAMNAAGPRGATITTGWKGNFTLASNVISTSGGAPRAYMDTTGMFRQPGDLNNLGSNGQFSLYMTGNSFAVNYTSSPCLFWASAGAGSGVIQPFAFFDILYAKSNVFGARTSGAEKGALFFTSGAAGTLGSFGGGFYAGNNAFSTPNVVINSAYSDASTTPNLLVVQNSIYTAPSPPITPVFPGGTVGLPIVDGMQLAAGDRVFAEDTCDATASGLYAADAGVWPRTTDYAVGTDVAGTFFTVLNGTQFGGTSWNCTNAPNAAVVGTDPLSFAQQ